MRTIGRWVIIAGAVVAATYAFAHLSFLASDIAFYTLIWGAAGTAWAIHAGPAGRLSLGHAAYFGIGAYAAAIIETRTSASVWLAIPVAMLLAGILGAGLELATARLEGIYYALATFAFAQLIWLVARSWQSLTNGTAGITVGFPTSTGVSSLIFAQSEGYVMVAAIFAVVAVGVAAGVHYSRIGYFVRALRDAPAAAAAAGLSANTWRPLTAGLSAALTAAVGIVVVQNVLFADPDSVLGFNISILIMLPAILGGTNVFYGSIIGAGMIVPLRQWLLSTNTGLPGGVQWIVYGVVLVVVVLALPQGITGFLASRFASFGHRFGRRTRV